MDRSSSEPPVTVEPYDHPSGGWGSLKSVTEKTLAEGLAVNTMLQMMTKQNKPDGFACVSCSWAKPAKSHIAEFCENGAKATVWEVTKKRCDRAFFARHRLSELRTWNDHDLEKEGRLTTPLRYDRTLDQYVPVSWADAFAEIGRELNALDPKSVVFYTSGRASLETSHMWQLYARIYGSQNLPDSSNMCHEPTSVGLKKSIGSPVGTVQIEDYDACDMMFFFGHNTGTNAPRLLHQVHDARLRGVPVVTFNPIQERGLVRFKDPQSPTEMISPDEGVKMSSDYFQVKVGGDLAAMTGIAKAVFALDDAAREAGKARVLDVAFIEEHGHGFEAFEAFVRAHDWSEIERCSGLSRIDLEGVGRTYARAKAVIANYGMGLTQHRHGTQNVQMLCNLLLMRGNIGRPGAGISPIRGHSNVQGQRTVGITEKPELAPLDTFAEFYGFEPPREKGLDTVEACEGILDGSVKAFLALGGNFVRAIPETDLMEAAWTKLRLSVQIATKLNRNHLLPAEVTYLLPCLGRIEEDVQATGKQHVSIEDSTACIHGSIGWRPPASPELLSEPKIVAELAKATVPGRSTVPWDEWVGDYSKVRDAIERTYPQYFKDFNQRFLQPGGFHRDLPACRREWETETKKAGFFTPTGFDVNPDIEVDGKTILTLITIRSNDQFNTTIYGYDDRLRGISGSRRVVLMNEGDMRRLGFVDQELVDIRTHADDEIDRRVEGFRVHAYSLPAGAVAGYYPELNPLMPLWHHDKEAHTPAAKSIPVEILKRMAA
ncbi:MULTISPECIES: FdhF/YdeP family oxidoreductase [unclassified Aureimonas]|uniref:FdhF/YdeP family oxidoreductase n=1 Tax=unclassified Aureimonas TaxID=2615206 RepID=UPI000701A812|nr:MULTISPECIES: FdhF/YdeP family oxidoreductase [unclassified Aureimonas]KQT61762.1 formate dehydrogenase [Aureimonas sp. Leaf460]KQT65718.1 formate dehydrogenase [Aureimonas sp. Leaf427]